MVQDSTLARDGIADLSASRDDSLYRLDVDQLQRHEEKHAIFGLRGSPTVDGGAVEGKYHGSRKRTAWLLAEPLSRLLSRLRFRLPCNEKPASSAQGKHHRRRGRRRYTGRALCDLRG